jgi:propanol-preferring alcohol dehydrogenase
MAETMPAYRVVAWQQQPQLVDAPVPEPAAGEVLIRVAGNGLCHSDAMMSQLPESVGDLLGWRVPFTLGHEIAGHVAAVGEGVAGLALGDAVALVSPTSCGACRYCRRGQDSACLSGGAGRGYGRDGGLTHYVVAPAGRGIVSLGELDPVAAAPLTDAGATSYHAVRRVLPRLLPGSTAVVIGAGGLGSFAVQLLRALSPAEVVAVDTNPARLAFAAELGAQAVLSSVTELTPTSADAVLDFVGVDETIAFGVAAVRPFGAFGVVGAAGGTFRRPWYGGLPRDGEVFGFQGSTIADLEDVVALAATGQIRSEVDVFRLSQVADAYEMLERGELRGRAVVVPD